ncbi:MAG: GspH/FimT family pseudopilin [Halieaceae bacterium]
MTIKKATGPQAGLTLIELMVVLFILAVVNALAGPALAETIKRNQLRSAAERVLLSLNLARSEAVKRNQTVSICRSTNGSSCGGSWEDGWIVFSNLDADDVVDSGVDEVIRVFDNVLDGHDLAGTVGNDTLSYSADGSYSGGSDTMRICSADLSLDHSWTVTVNTVGRPRASIGASSCS